MTMSRRIGMSLLAAVIGVLSVEIGDCAANTSIFGFVSPAEARVGRPLTPVSVAGVGRRTVRRCAAGVYYC